MSDAVGPFTVTAVIATVAIVIVLANTALSAFGATFKDVTGTDIFMQPQYTAVWERVSQFAWAIVTVAFVAAAFTVWRVIRER
jgi:hypothetical protein